MDMFISECCRYQTIIPALERKCVKDYVVPGTEIIIPKGRFVKVYTKDISNSEDNFKRPEVFDPENFAPDDLRSRSPELYWNAVCSSHDQDDYCLLAQETQGCQVG